MACLKPLLPIESSHRQGGDGSYSGNDPRRFMADEDLQALQLQRIRHHASQWLSASTSQSQNRIPTDLLRNGLHGNAHQQFHRELLLEFRRTVPGEKERKRVAWSLSMGGVVIV